MGSEKTTEPVKNDFWKDLLKTPEKIKDKTIDIYVKIILIIIGYYLSSIAFFLTWINSIKHKSFFGVIAPPEHRALPPEILEKYGQHKNIQIPNERLYCVYDGDPSLPVLILLHGFPDFWFSWREQIKHFTSKYHVVAVDLRGYGYSEKYPFVWEYTLDKLVEDLKNLIEELSKQQKVTIIAHDWGAVILYSFLLKHSNLVEKYVTLSFFPPYAWKFNIKQLIYSWYILFFQLPILPELYLRQFDLDSPFLKELYNNQKKEVIDSYKFVFGKPGALTPPIHYYRANAVALVKYLIFGTPDLSSKHFPPGLALYGEKDGFVSVSSYKNVDKVPGLKAKEIKGANHFLHQQDPEAVNKAIDEFLYGGTETKPPTTGIPAVSPP